MGPVSAKAIVDAPRDSVFGLLLDLANRPALARDLIDEFHLLRVDPVGVGAGARFRLRESGARLDSTIVRAESPHRIDEQGHGGRWNRIPCHTVWELLEGPGSEQCEVSVTFWTEPEHPADRLHEPFGSERRLQRGWRRTLQRIKDAAEGGQPVERVAVAGGPPPF